LSHTILRGRCLTTIAEAFVICTGGSEPQLAAITASHWIVLDYGSVIVHVFTPPEREFYKLEQLWASAKVLLRIQ